MAFTWATDPSAVVTAPSGARQLVGYVDRNKPPAGEFNWLFQQLGTVTGQIEAIDTDIGNLVTSIGDVADDLDLVKNPATTTATQSGRTITQIDSGTKRWVISWTGNRISSIAYQDPAGSTVATYTPTYATSGRAITTWTKS